MNDVIHTEITGTFKELEIGKIYLNRDFTKYNEEFKISMKVLRESNEQEYRERYNYHGPLPIDPFGTKARFYEIVVLD